MNILIIGPSWIGDAIMSQITYRLLIQNKHKVNIDVIAPNWNQAVFYRMPEIRKVLSLTYLKHKSFPLKKYYQLGKSLKNNQYQQSIILPNSFKSSLIPFFAHIPKRTGWRGEMRYGLINDMRILKPENFPLMLQRYAALAFENKQIKHANDLPNLLPWPELECNLYETNVILKKFKINDNNNHHERQKKIIGICPGAEFGPAKCWPAHHYATLITQILDEGYQAILLGSQKDIPIGKIIDNNIQKNLQMYYHNLIGLTSLDEAILLIKRCNAIVSNDSGLMHVACALHKPVIALYGPTNPQFTPPLYSAVKIIQNNKNFSYKKIKRTNHPHGYHKSLINIHPNIVLKELNRLLKEHDKKS